MEMTQRKLSRMYKTARRMSILHFVNVSKNGLSAIWTALPGVWNHLCYEKLTEWVATQQCQMFCLDLLHSKLLRSSWMRLVPPLISTSPATECDSDEGFLMNHSKATSHNGVCKWTAHMHADWYWVTLEKPLTIQLVVQGSWLKVNFTTKVQFQYQKADNKQYFDMINLQNQGNIKM